MARHYSRTWITVYKQQSLACEELAGLQFDWGPLASFFRWQAPLTGELLSMGSLFRLFGRRASWREAKTWRRVGEKLARNNNYKLGRTQRRAS